MRFQFQPGVDPTRVASLGLRFIGGSDANGTAPAPAGITIQIYDFQASAWVTAGTNTTGSTGGGFTEEPIADITSNPSHFFDSDGDVWVQAFVATDAVTSNNLELDYVALEVTERGEGLIIQAGANAGNEIELFLPDARTAALGLSGLSVATRSAAENALTTTISALDELSSTRTTIGSSMNRLSQTVSFLGIQQENLFAADSRIRELDYADEIVKFTRDQILQQTGVSALAQANLIPSAVLALLG